MFSNRDFEIVREKCGSIDEKLCVCVLFFYVCFWDWSWGGKMWQFSAHLLGKSYTINYFWLKHRMSWDGKLIVRYFDRQFMYKCLFPLKNCYWWQRFTNMNISSFSAISKSSNANCLSDFFLLLSILFLTGVW